MKIIKRYITGTLIRFESNRIRLTMVSQHFKAYLTSIWTTYLTFSSINWTHGRGRARAITQIRAIMSESEDFFRVTHFTEPDGNFHGKNIWAINCQRLILTVTAEISSKKGRDSCDKQSRTIDPITYKLPATCLYGS